MCCWSVSAPSLGHAESASGRFEDLLAGLQRHGPCSDLPRFGVSTHRGRNPDDINIKLIGELGAQFVRIDIPWSEVEKDGTFDFGQFDYLVGTLRQKKTAMLLILDYGHPDHTDGGLASGFPFVPRSPEQQQAYLRYVRATVERFHGPDITYEVWNEPNLELFWPLSATAYGNLLKSAAATIREVDPAASILAAGIANPPNRDSFVREMIAATSLDQINGLAFHPYRQDGPENSLRDIADFYAATRPSGIRLPAWLTDAKANPRQLPLWLTEWGYSEAWFARTYPADNPRERQATMVARLMLTAALAKAKVAIAYDLIDDGPDASDPEFKFGLYDYAFKAKESAFAFRKLASLMSTCETYDFHFEPSRKLVSAVFKGRVQVAYVFWTYDGKRSQDVCFDLGASKASQVFSITGKQFPIALCQSSANIKLTVSESAGPMILTAVH